MGLRAEPSGRCGDCNPPAHSLPAQLLLQKLKRPHAVDRVRAVEVLDGRAVADEELIVEAADFGELVVHPFVDAHAVVVAALDHEGAWGDQCGHLRIVEGAAHVPFPDFILASGDVAHRHVRAHALAHPFV